ITRCAGRVRCRCLDLEQELDGLYGLPLDEFTAARNRLARTLAQEGDPRAEEVRRLPKPTPAVWAINQLARREPRAVRRLLSAGRPSRSNSATANGNGNGETASCAIARAGSSATRSTPSTLPNAPSPKLAPTAKQRTRRGRQPTRQPRSCPTGVSRARTSSA